MRAAARHPRAAGSRRRSRGFTLVELMIAMTLSLVMVAALVSLVVANGRAHDELDRSSRQIENGRYAMDVLADDLQLAGFYGELSLVGADRTTPDPCAEAVANLGWSDSPFEVPTPVQAYAGGEAGPGCVENRRDGTPVLVVRRMNLEPVDLAAYDEATPAVQVSRCENDPSTTHMVFGTDAAAFTLRNLACDAEAPLRTYAPRIYYVSDCSDCEKGDAIPTLKRLDLVGGELVETPIAEGIEEVQFEYGFDTSGDGVPDEYRTGLDGVGGSAANDWSNVMAVRIWLVSRTMDATPGYQDQDEFDLGPTFGARGPYGDAFKRRVYTSTVRLVNPAGQRE